jgi:hypothetical protein
MSTLNNNNDQITQATCINQGFAKFKDKLSHQFTQQHASIKSDNLTFNHSIACMREMWRHTEGYRLRTDSSYNTTREFNPVLGAPTSLPVFGHTDGRQTKCACELNFQDQCSTKADSKIRKTQEETLDSFLTRLTVVLKMQIKWKKPHSLRNKPDEKSRKPCKRGCRIYIRQTSANCSTHGILEAATEFRCLADKDVHHMTMPKRWYKGWGKKPQYTYI